MLSEDAIEGAYWFGKDAEEEVLDKEQEKKAQKELDAYWAGSVSGMLRKKEIKGG